MSREVKDAAAAADVIADATREAVAKTATPAKRTPDDRSQGSPRPRTARTKATATSARKAAPRARKATKAAADEGRRLTAVRPTTGH